jgi:DNA-binding NtrC family response regulator
MQMSVVVVNSNVEECRELCALLSGREYPAVSLSSLAELKECVRKGFESASLRVIIVDLDNLSVDNRLFRDLSKDYPNSCVIGLSSRTFHPELQEALSRDISACLLKPIDMDELVYWLRSVCDRESNSRDSPCAHRP